MLRRIGSDSQLIEADEISRLQPHMAVEDTIAVFEPNCGTAYGAKANESLLAGAMRHGVRIFTRLPVLSLLKSYDRVVGIKTSEGEIHADVVVLAAGAWSADLARTIGVPLPVQARRLTIGRVLMPPGIRRPMTFLDGRFDTSFRPEEGSTALISMRDEKYGQPIEPDSRKEDVDATAVTTGIDRIKQRIPAADQFVGLNTWTGVDGFTPDFRGIYGEHHECSNLFVIAGASEKGFKVSPAVGMATAELIATGKSPDIQKPEFSSARFDQISTKSVNAGFGVEELI